MKGKKKRERGHEARASRVKEREKGENERSKEGRNQAEEKKNISGRKERTAVSVKKRSLLISSFVSCVSSKSLTKEKISESD